MSIGNILSYEGGTKLADLEYAKKINGDTTCHHMRTVIEFSNKLFAQTIELYPARAG